MDVTAVDTICPTCMAGISGESRIKVYIFNRIILRSGINAPSPILITAIYNDRLGNVLDR
jgi:hypothetical protein